MPNPQPIRQSDSCSTCTRRLEHFFCNLAPETLDIFDSVTFTMPYPSGAVLFAEGEAPRGVFMLCDGRAKMTIGSSDGKSLITRLASSGELLGLSSVLTGETHKATLEIVEPSTVKFIRRDDFLRFVREHGEACFQASQQLSMECDSATEHIRSLGLSRSAAEKLAHLILTWADESGKETAEGIRLKLAMKHTDIAQLIGTSRETVTRLLSDLRQKQIIETRGSTLLIRKREALQAMVAL